MQTTPVPPRVQPVLRAAGWLLTLAMAAGCATGVEMTPVDDQEGGPVDVAGSPADQRPADQRLADQRPAGDQVVPRDQAPPDRSTESRLDRADLAIPADHRTPPDGQKPCPDVFEPNNTCPASGYLGVAEELAGWTIRSATLSPQGDVDWFSADGWESPHVCLPLAAQCYKFSVRVDVPAGRIFQVCVSPDLCSGTQRCADNKQQAGPFQLLVDYKLTGICGLNDDTTASIVVKPLDGSSSCTPYKVAFRYDEC